MSDLKYDNERDRFAHGYDAGTIVDGVVTLDETTRRFVLVDEDGLAFDSQVVLQALIGKKVRMTMVSFESLEAVEALLQGSQSNQPS